METVLKSIETLLASEKNPVLLSIEGGAGSGKTELAQRLQKQFGGSVYHMDDFFLPPDMRTKERLETPGGNVHYERFREEVMQGIFSGKPFSYGVFDCMLGAIRERRTVYPQKLHIIEGVYSAHPVFGDVYDLRIFLEVDTETQHRRISARNGKDADRFFEKWIPMENRYFEAFRVRENSDIVLKNDIP